MIHRMVRNAVRLLAAAAAVVLIAALVVFAFGDDEAMPTDELVAGQIYSTDDGDPIDVFYEIDDTEMGCMSVGGSSGIVYGGRVSCFEPEELEEGGTYKLVIPASTVMPAHVVGVMPAGATGALVSAIGWETARAETRGQWFLAWLEPADPSPYDLADIRIEFDY